MKKGSILLLFLGICFSNLLSQNIFSRTYDLENQEPPGYNTGIRLVATDTGYALLNFGNCLNNTLICVGLHLIDLKGNISGVKPFIFSEYGFQAARSLILTTDRHYLTTGLDIIPGGTDGDELRMWLMKLNSRGDTSWLRIFDSPTEEDEDANDAIETPAKDGYYLHGDVGQDFKYFFKRIIRTDTAGA